MCELATSRGGPWRTAGRSTGRSLVLTKLRPGRTYWVRVEARSDAGTSPWSAKVKVRVPAG